MGGLSSPLEFEDITRVLQNTRGRIATVATIANRLERGVSIVQRALDRMREAGGLELVPTFKGEQYRLLDGPGVTGTVQPYRDIAPPPIVEGDFDRDDDVAEETEGMRAESIWRARMGNLRWTDDPRALRERAQQQHCLPPFYNTLAREI